MRKRKGTKGKKVTAAAPPPASNNDQTTTAMMRMGAAAPPMAIATNTRTPYTMIPPHLNMMRAAQQLQQLSPFGNLPPPRSVPVHPSPMMEAQGIKAPKKAVPQPPPQLPQLPQPQPELSRYVQQLHATVDQLRVELNLVRLQNMNILKTFHEYRQANPPRELIPPTAAEPKTKEAAEAPTATAVAELTAKDAATPAPTRTTATTTNESESNPSEEQKKDDAKDDEVASLKNHIEKLQKRVKLEYYMRVGETKKADKIAEELRTLRRESNGFDDAMTPSRPIRYADEVSTDEDSIEEAMTALNNNGPRIRKKRKRQHQQPEPPPPPQEKPRIGRRPKPTPPTVFERAEYGDKRAVKWVEKLKVLRAFTETHGHCNPPKAFDPKLYTWVTDLRTSHRYLREGKPNGLSADKIRALNEIGFQWQVGPMIRTWDENFQRLKKYAAQHGHCRVPQKKPGKGYEGLGDWVLLYRRAYRKNQNKLDPERIRKLEEIGFEWSLRNRGGTLEERMSFERMPAAAGDNGASSDNERGETSNGDVNHHHSDHGERGHGNHGERGEHGMKNHRRGVDSAPVDEEMHTGPTNSATSTNQMTPLDLLLEFVDQA